MNALQRPADLSWHDEGGRAAHVAAEDRRAVRGVGWVVRWTAALATLAVTTCSLAEFGYGLAAERTLARAARAGALEATLPRASHRSVAATVERRLDGRFSRPNCWRFLLEQNGTPVHGLIQPKAGDQLAVTLAIPADAALPSMLRRLLIWRSETRITVRAEREMPGRRLRPSLGS